MKPSKKFFLVTIGIIIINLVLLFLRLDICIGQQQSKEKFPNRPITLIVNFGAGGSTDVAVRPLAQIAEKQLGVPIIILNKPGGGGTVGMGELARGKPDGYTIGTITIFTVGVIPFLQQVPYNPSKDFDYICGFGQYLYGIFAKIDSPFKSIKDVVEAAQKNPGKITYGAGSIGIALGVKYLEVKENKKMTYIPFQSGTESATALLGGHINLSAGGPDHIQFIESKEIKALAVVSKGRWSILPDVPTMKELGYDVDNTGWMALGAPTGVPKDRLETIYNAFQVASNDPNVKVLYERLKVSAPYITGEEVKKIYQNRAIEWKPLIEVLKADQTKK